MKEIYLYAFKLLQGRDYSIAALRQKLQAKFGSAPPEVIDDLIGKKFLNDRRFAENYIARHKDRGSRIVREDLVKKGIEEPLLDEILSRADWPSLKEALADKMNQWHLQVPLQSRDAARLFRSLSRLGYDEDAIRGEIEQLHEQ
jgi:SOS response regulatory protein OraA/RecX